MRKLTLILFFIWPVIFCCNKEDLGTIPHGYFTFEYINYAWGYQHSGWIIDSTGIVKGFNLPEFWNYTDASGYISKSELEENLIYCTTMIDEVSEKTLNKYNNLIDAASKGSLSEIKNIGQDGGGLEYCCYLFDSNLNLYKKVTIDVQGDQSYYNKSHAAKDILKWMKKLN